MNKLISKYVFVTYIVQSINVAVNFVFSLLMVGLLGAAGYGDYSIFYNSLAFAVLLFGFNLPSVLVFFIANQRAEPGKLLFSSLLFTLFTAVGLALLLFFSSDLHLAVHIFPGGDNKSIWIFFFVALFFLLQVNQLLAAFLNAHKIFIPVSVVTLVCNILLILFWTSVILKLIKTEIPVFNLVWWVSIIINACIAVYSVWLICTKTAVKGFWQLINRKELKVLAGFAIIVYLCNTIQFLNYKMDIWFVSYYSGNKEAGIYSLALSLSQLIWILPNAISAVLLNYFQVKQPDQSVKLATTYAQVSFYLSWITAIILLAIYYFALPYFYGSEFRDTFWLCALLFIGTIPFSLSIMIANLNSGIGFVRLNLYATVFIFAVGFILDILVIPKYGVMGAAVTKTFIYILGLIFQIIVCHVFYKLPWIALFRFPRLKTVLNKEIPV